MIKHLSDKGFFQGRTGHSIISHFLLLSKDAAVVRLWHLFQQKRINLRQACCQGEGWGGHVSEISTSTPGKSNSGSQCRGATCLQDATTVNHTSQSLSGKYFPRTYHPNHSISPNVGKYALSVTLVFSRSLSGARFFFSQPHNCITFLGFQYTEVYCMFR